MICWVVGRVLLIAAEENVEAMTLPYDGGKELQRSEVKFASGRISPVAASSSQRRSMYAK